MITEKSVMQIVNGGLSALFAGIDLLIAYGISCAWDIDFDRALIVVVLISIHSARLSLDYKIGESK